ncbi:MAG TPA: sulfotransferase [Streptosporangiales bacterium]
MALRVIGAGLPRTGTASLKAALERLLGGRCYHMLELFEHPEHLSFWRDTARGGQADWRAFFAGYDAAVDWPASQYWRELMDVYPDAPVLLSVRDSAQTWWRSADATVFGNARRAREAGGEIPPRMREFVETLRAAMERLSPRWYEQDGAIEAYERHNAEVRATVPAERLVEWRPGDGWEPLARMLDVPVPDEPFPHQNTTAEFQAGTAERAARFFAGS